MSNLKKLKSCTDFQEPKIINTMEKVYIIETYHGNEELMKYKLTNKAFNTKERCERIISDMAEKIYGKPVYDENSEYEGGAEQGPGPEICFFNLKPNHWLLLHRLTPGPLGTLGSSSPLRGQPKSSVASSPRQSFPGLDFTLPLSLLPPKITSGLPPNRIPLHTTGLAQFSQGKAGVIRDPVGQPDLCLL